MRHRAVISLLALFAIWLTVAPSLGDPDPATGSLSGRVVEGDTDDPLPGAVIAILGTSRGAWVGEDGEYTISDLEPGTYTVECSHIGHRTQALQVTVPAIGEAHLEFSLVAEVIRLSAITVTPSRFAIMGFEPHTRQILTEEEIQSLPHFGEDIYRAVTRLPGISANDFSAQFTVRGGEHDEVLVLLDNLQLYEPFHLKDISGGAVSIVDVEVIEGIDLLTGGYPAEYGDRLSAVFSIRSRTPEPGHERHALGISFMNARAMSEGTFERGSWLVSARRGYLDMVLWLMNEDEKVSPTYYDLLGKVEYQLSPRNRLSAHVLHARDTFELVEDDDDEDDTGYGNSYGWVNLKSTIGPRLAAVSTLHVGRVTGDRQGTAYQSINHELLPDFDVSDERSFNVLGLKQDWNWEVADNHFLKWGVDLRRLSADYDYLYTQHRSYWVTPDSMVAWIDTTDIDRSPSGTSVGVYGAYRLRLSPQLTVELGSRYDRASYADDNLLSPRLNFVFTVDSETSIRGGWGHYYQSQGIHEIAVQDGEDQFYPAERGEHWVIGLERHFPSGLQMRLEAYRKHITDRHPSYRNWQGGIEIFPEAQPDRLRVELERTKARGLELYLKQDTGGKFTWWASYALSRIRDRVSRVSPRYGSVDLDRSLPGVYDQQHTIYLDANYRPSPRWCLNLAWQYHTGWPYTPQVMRRGTWPDGSHYNYTEAGEPYGERYPDYHRLDLRASRYFDTSRGRVSVFLEFVNLYNRGNVANYEYWWRGSSELGYWLDPRPDYWFKLLPSLGVSWSWGD